MRRAQKRYQQGYTLIEILIVVVITAIGFAAVFSLQIATLQGNISARDSSAAVNLAERYAESLRRDAFMWRQGPPSTVSYDGNRTVDNGARLATDWLVQNPDVWHPMTGAPVDQNGSLYIDDDANFGSNLSRQRFCVHYRLSPLAGNYDGIISAHVRVVWPRSAMDTQSLRTANICGDPTAFDDDADQIKNWFSVTVPATLRRHPG